MTISVWVAWTEESTYFDSLLLIHFKTLKATPKRVIDMRNTDKEYLHEKATPKRVIDMRNTDKEYLHEKATPKRVIDMRQYRYTDKEYLHEKAVFNLALILCKGQ